MNDNFKPDLGTHYSELYNKEIVHNFYSVPCHEIDYVAPNLYSIMENIIIAEKEYAASFNFSLGTLGELLKQITNSNFREYLISVLLQDFNGPQKAKFHNTPFLIDVKAKLGEPVKSLYETFTPFIAEEILITISS